MSRHDLLVEASEKCLNEIYSKSQPGITWNEILENAKNGLYKDVSFIEHHYMPNRELEEIIDHYISEYRIHNEWKDDAELMIKYLLNGGAKEVYLKNEKGVPNHRTYENVPSLKDSLKEILNNSELEEKVHDKVFELMNNCKDFYNPNSEENSFLFTIHNYAPFSNKEVVQKHYSDLTIYDRDYNPITNEWVNVTPETIENWKEELESYESEEEIDSWDNYCIKQLKNLINKYDK